MAIEASFTVEQSDFPLSAVFEQLPNVTIELDRVVPTTKSVVPYFWIYTDNVDKLRTDLPDDTGIDGITIIDKLAEQMFVRINWNLAHESVLTAIVNTDITLLSGIGNNEQWTFEIRASEQAEVSEFQTYCREHDLPIKLTQLHALSPVTSNREYDLTTEQRETLKLAYSRGYFDSPRTVTQEEISDELGITHQAVSSRLQRGIRRLVASTLVVPQK